MRRILIPLAALAVAAPSTTAALRQAEREAMTPRSSIDFTLAPASRGGRFRLALSSGRHFNSSFDVSVVALAGFNPAQLDRGGPLHFALIREAGRFDCGGAGAGGRGQGQCRFTPDASFAGFLTAHGNARPTFEQSFQLAVTRATRALVQALADARYPAPSCDQLAGLAALGVTRDYIASLAAHGYRPARIEELLSFKAVGVTPEYVEGLRRSGYAAMRSEAVVQFRALGVTPSYLADLAGAGYRGLSPEDVVQLRALGVTSAWIEGFTRAGYPHLPVGKLVEMKATGVTPADVRAAERSGRR